MIIILVIVLSLVFIVINVVFYFFQEKVIFQGSNIPDSFQYTFDFPYKEIFIKRKNAVLHGLLIKSEQSKGVILYFHGNRGDIRRWGKIGKSLVTYGFDVLVVDYRGYGKSRGERAEEYLYQDGQLFYDHLKEKLAYDRIIIYGRSLGSAIATSVAFVKNCELLILESPMTKLVDIIPWFKKILILPGIHRYKFDSLSRVDKIKCPTYVFHGTSDRLVPIRLGLQLYNAISTPNKKFIRIDNGKHNNLDSFGGYKTSMKSILGN